MIPDPTKLGRDIFAFSGEVLGSVAMDGKRLIALELKLAHFYFFGDDEGSFRW